MKILLEENPLRKGGIKYKGGSMYGFYNPRRHRRHHKRNPLGLPNTKAMLMGLDMKDILGATGGLAISTLVPNMVVKSPTSTSQKLMRVGVSVVAAIAAGYLSKSLLGQESAKYVTIGGLAGAAAIALANFTTYKITPTGTAAPVARVIPSGMHRSLGAPASYPSQESETSIITNVT